MIQYKHSNIFDSGAEALVNTVNLVGIMGKGVALQFKELFPLNFRLYQKACKNNELKIGKMFVTMTGRLTGPKYIINFPTKTDWRSFTKLDFINHGLDDLVKVIKELDIKSIAVPPLGCGNGGLDWKVVKPLIESKLRPLADSVFIEVYEPGYHSYTKTKVREEIPELTKARALVLALADRYNVLGFDISHLEIQKLTFFLQEFGQSDLKLKFEKGHYGPYALNLKHLLAHLEGSYFIGQIRFQDMKPADSLKLVKEHMPKVHSFLETTLTEDEQIRLKQVSDLIEGFESPFGMELLATVLWAKKATASNDLKVVTDYIYDWSERKRDFMKAEQIEIALKRLIHFF
jgi:O-acetyl-ADP-ribose deacetylase (regulator of RNase III)